MSLLGIVETLFCDDEACACTWKSQVSIDVSQTESGEAPYQ